MNSVIEFRDTWMEHGTFDDAVASAERRIAELERKGFRDAMSEISPFARDAETQTARSWKIELRARKEASR